MKLKSFVVIGILLLIAGLVAAAYGSELPVFAGRFRDGATIQWVCPPGASGTIPFQFTTPSGDQYQAALKCGEPV